jgi:hypothetical protein
MALPWIAVGKLVFANLDTIVGVAKPLFTRKKAESLPTQADLINQQIAELQAASSGNAEQIRELAAQLKQVVAALDEAAAVAASEREGARKLAIAALAASALSLIAVVVLVVVR